MPRDDLQDLADPLAARGFRFAPAEDMRAHLGALADWDTFSASWNDLPRDMHLPDGHRYRRRRHATLSARAGESTFHVEPQRPHYQAVEYNRLVGGIERWFEPIQAPILAGASFRSVMALCLRLFGALQPRTDWHIECHQFRIEARPEAAGQPTPEGVHRDGVDWVLVLLVSRVNIESGTTTVHDMEDRALGSFTLATPLDAALVDDKRVKHGVTAVTPTDRSRPAWRDVLVVTFRRRG
jgi:hypothetical protein